MDEISSSHQFCIVICIIKTAYVFIIFLKENNPQQCKSVKRDNAADHLALHLPVLISLKTGPLALTKILAIGL